MQVNLRDKIRCNGRTQGVLADTPGVMQNLHSISVSSPYGDCNVILESAQPGALYF